MKWIWYVACLLIVPFARPRADLPPATAWIPGNAIAYVTLQDWPALQRAFSNSPVGKTWHDNALLPFRSRTEECLLTHLLESLPESTGLTSTQLLHLARGQVSAAWFASPEGHRPNGARFAWVLAADARELKPDLDKTFATARQNAEKTKRIVATARLGDVDVFAVALRAAGTASPAPPPPPPPAPPVTPGPASPTAPAKSAVASSNAPPELCWIGVSGSALLMSNSRDALARTLGSLAQPGTNTLASNPSVRSAAATLLPGATLHGWMDYRAVEGMVADHVSRLFSLLASLGAKPDDIASAIGLTSLQSFSISGLCTPEGLDLQWNLAVPEASRAGLFKMLQILPKDAGPTAFVPRDAIGFQRWRVSGPAFWKTLEDALNRISPQILGLFRLTLETMGQAEDSRFSVKRNFQDALGDDILSFQVAPAKGAKETKPASGVWIGSPRSEALAAAVRTVYGLQQLQGGNAAIQQRDFLGHTIHEIVVPSENDNDAPARTLLAATASHVVIADSASLIEAFIRNPENAAPSLATRPDFAAAAARVGGFNSGLFAYEDASVFGRTEWEALRKGDLESLGTFGITFLSLLGPAAGCLEFERLPPYDAVKSHPNVFLMGGATDAAGYRLRWHIGSVGAAGVPAEGGKAP